MHRTTHSPCSVACDQNDPPHSGCLQSLGFFCFSLAKRSIVKFAPCTHFYSLCVVQHSDMDMHLHCMCLNHLAQNNVALTTRFGQHHGTNQIKETPSQLQNEDKCDAPCMKQACETATSSFHTRKTKAI